MKMMRRRGALAWAIAEGRHGRADRLARVAGRQGGEGPGVRRGSRTGVETEAQRYAPLVHLRRAPASSWPGPDISPARGSGQHYPRGLPGTPFSDIVEGGMQVAGLDLTH